MGGADVYCAICGGPLSTVRWREEDDDETVYDPAVLQPDSPKLRWLDDVRLIGDNRRGTALSSAWVSGLAAQDEVGIFGLEEPNDPVIEELGRDYVQTYCWDGNGPFAVPYHTACHKILSLYLRTDSQGIDKDIFLGVIRQLTHTSRYGHALNIDYGSIGNNHEQYWCVSRGEEHYVHSPLQIPELADYYMTLPRLNLDGEMEAHSTSQREPTSDPLARLPHEILLLIMGCLDMTSIARLFRASRTCYNVSISNSWWKFKLFRDLSCLFDFPEVEESEAVDWARVYRDLWVGSRENSASRVHGLANRRRIWDDILPQIAIPYMKARQKEMNSGEKPPILIGARSTGYPRLVAPEPKGTGKTFVFAPTIAGLADADIAFHVHLDQNGYVRGIVLVGAAEESLEHGPPFEFATSVEAVSIPRNDHLTGFIVTSRCVEGVPVGSRRNIVGLEFLLGHSDTQQVGSNEGDKRLIHVSDDHFAVGLEVIGSRESGLSKISLIEQPCHLAVGMKRFISNASPPYDKNLQAMPYLWRGHIPPAGLRASEYRSGYGSTDMKEDLSPMEALVFGRSEEELADIVSVAVDVQFGGIEVRYGNRPSRSIGPRRHALKTLTVDGQGQERIMYAYCTVTIQPSGLRLVTNRGRQLVIGKSGENEVRLPPVVAGTGQLACLAGMYGWWSSRPTPRAKLDAVGCLYTPELGVKPLPPVETPEHSGPRGIIQWEPTTLDDSLEAVGPVLGQFACKISLRGPFNVPDICDIASWLDCTRPLSAVCVTTCHSTKERQLPVCAISFNYADGERKDVGADDFPQPPTDTEGKNGNCWCWCAFNSREDDEIGQHPHYQHSVWQLDGKRLKSIRSLLSPVADEVGEGNRLAGIQFVAEDGSESPVWSHWNRGPDSEYVIESITFSDDTVGLKFFMGLNGRAVTYDDTVIMSIQAVTRKGP